MRPAQANVGVDVCDFWNKISYDLWLSILWIIIYSRDVELNPASVTFEGVCPDPARLAQVFAHAFSLQDPIETLSRFYKASLPMGRG